MVEKYRLNGLSGWILAVISVGAVLITVGTIWKDVSDGTDDNKRQDIVIVRLQQDMAVIKSTTQRTQEDVKKLDGKMDTLLSRP